MEVLNLKARNNQSFVFPRSLSGLLSVFSNLAQARFRGAIRDTGGNVVLRFTNVPTDTPAAGTFEFSGAASVSGATYVLIATAPQSAVVGLSGIYNYDVQLVLPGVVKDIFGGTVEFDQGATPYQAA